LAGSTNAYVNKSNFSNGALSIDRASPFRFAVGLDVAEGDPFPLLVGHVCFVLPHHARRFPFVSREQLHEEDNTRIVCFVDSHKPCDLQILLTLRPCAGYRDHPCDDIIDSVARMIAVASTPHLHV